jgi:hypothetical protein
VIEDKFVFCLGVTWGHAVVQLVEALRYKPEGCGLDSRWGYRDFSFTCPTDRTVALRTTEFLTEMSTRNICGGVGKVADA